MQTSYIVKMVSGGVRLYQRYDLHPERESFPFHREWGWDWVPCSDLKPASEGIDFQNWPEMAEIMEMGRAGEVELGLLVRKSWHEVYVHQAHGGAHLGNFHFVAGLESTNKMRPRNTESPEATSASRSVSFLADAVSSASI